MVKRAAGKLVLIADRRRHAAPVERSGLAPALVAHSNDDLPPPSAPVIVAPDDAKTSAGGVGRDPLMRKALAGSIVAHLALAACIVFIVPGASVTPATMAVEVVSASMLGDISSEDADEAPPEIQSEAPPASVAAEPLPEPAPPEPPSEPVAEAPPPPPPPEPTPEPVPEPMPEPPPVAELPEPEPPPVVEKTPEPVVEKPPPPRPKPVRVKRPKPVERPVAITPPAPVEAPRAEVPEVAKPETPAEGATAPSHAAVDEQKVPQQAAAPIPSPAVPRLTDADYKRRPSPGYPSRARDMNWEGTVMVKVLIGVGGEPLAVEITKSSGFPILDEEARRAAKRALFKPKTVNGRPVESEGEFPIHFKLK